MWKKFLAVTVSAPIILMGSVLLIMVVGTTVIQSDSAPLGDIPTALHLASDGTQLPGEVLLDSLQAVHSPCEVSAQLPRAHFDSRFIDRRRIALSRYAKRRRKNSDAKREAARQRKELLERTSQDIDEIIAEFNAKLPRDQAVAAGAVYLRYSTRFQDSVADQLREILRFALDQKIFVPRSLVFFDLAVRGCTNSRAGLDQLRAALRGKAAQVLLLFSTSRLFRRQYRTLQFVDEVYRGLKIRCVFVKSGVDTNNNERWEAMLAIQSMVDQFVVSMNVANIQAAHQGLLSKRLVFGTLSYGYTGEPLPDQFTKRKRPRCRIVIDPVTSKIVKQIFQWFVEDKLSLAKIVQNLNEDDSIPLPPRATTGMWTRLAVKTILKNSRYRAIWKYGICESTYLPEQDYTRQYVRSEALMEMEIEELRIVPDTMWFAAQVRLVAEAANGGRKAKDDDQISRPDATRRIFWCPEHERFLYSGGANGHKLICPDCQRLDAVHRPLFTLLDRRLAFELLCEELAGLIKGDESLVQEIVAACQLEVEAAQRPDPARLTQLQADLEKLQRRIAFIRKTVDPTNSDDETAAEKDIKELQGRLKEVTAEHEFLRAAMTVQPVMPSREQVQFLLDELHLVLIQATSAEVTEAERAAVQEVIKLLTGGRVNLHQHGERKAGQGWLEGRFTVRLLPVLVERLTGGPATATNNAIEVVIEFKRPVSFDQDAERAWQLDQQGKLRKEIAQELGCSKSNVTRLLKYAAEKHGQPLEDGRSRRSKLAKKHVDPQLYERVVDDVMRRYHAQELLQDIAEATGVCRDTITAIVRKWHQERGLPVPDGRVRRKDLPEKTSRREESVDNPPADTNDE